VFSVAEEFTCIPESRCGRSRKRKGEGMEKKRDFPGINGKGILSWWAHCTKILFLSPAEKQLRVGTKKEKDRGTPGHLEGRSSNRKAMLQNCVRRGG